MLRRVQQLVYFLHMGAFCNTLLLTFGTFLLSPEMALCVEPPEKLHPAFSDKVSDEFLVLAKLKSLFEILQNLPDAPSAQNFRSQKLRGYIQIAISAHSLAELIAVPDFPDRELRRPPDGSPLDTPVDRIQDPQVRDRYRAQLADYVSKSKAHTQELSVKQSFTSLYLASREMSRALIRTRFLKDIKLAAKLMDEEIADSKIRAEFRELLTL